MPDKPLLKRPVSPSIETTAPSPAPTASPSIPVASPVITNPRDLDRSRAEFAWRCVCDVTNESENHRKKYGSLARKMPTLIQVNGLAQTLAFLKAKGEKNDYQVQMCKHLSEWICNRFKLGTGDLLSDYILKMDSQRYRLITSESLAFLQWLKRFAEAELGSEEDN